MNQTNTLSLHSPKNIPYLESLTPSKHDCEHFKDDLKSSNEMSSIASNHLEIGYNKNIIGLLQIPRERRKGGRGGGWREGNF